MSDGSSLATFCCFTTVAALGFFLFGGRDATWCYVVGSVCLLPVIGVVMYAWCIYPCKEKQECCYAEEGCLIYCLGYEEPSPKLPKTKTKPRRTGNPKLPAEAPPAYPQDEQMATAPRVVELGSAPRVVELRQVVIQT